MTCLLCPTPLSKHQERYCSVRCQRNRAPRVREVAALIDATAGQWMTLADIAIWIFGDDTLADTAAARMNLARLRARGYVFERRLATWGPIVLGGRYAYRLVAAPSEWRWAA